MAYKAKENAWFWAHESVLMAQIVSAVIVLSVCVIRLLFEVGDEVFLSCGALVMATMAVVYSMKYARYSYGRGMFKRSASVHKAYLSLALVRQQRAGQSRKVYMSVIVPLYFVNVAALVMAALYPMAPEVVLEPPSLISPEMMPVVSWAIFAQGLGLAVFLARFLGDAVADFLIPRGA